MYIESSGTDLILNIPTGAKVIWNAYFYSYHGLQFLGGGSFESAAGKIDVGGIHIPSGTSTVTLNGNIDFWGNSWGSGAYSTGSTLIINGNLTISGDDHQFRASIGEVIVNGNVNITGGSPSNESYVGVEGGGVMTINGSLTTLDDDEYVMIDGVWFAKGDYETVSSKACYREYTDGTSFVFVKPDGGSNILLIVAIAVAVIAAIGVAAYFLVIRKP